MMRVTRITNGGKGEERKGSIQDGQQCSVVLQMGCGQRKSNDQWGAGFLAQVSVLVTVLLTNRVVAEDKHVSLFQMGWWIEWVKEKGGAVFGA